MSETIINEIGRRAKRLHRKNWLNKRVGNSNSDVIVGAVSIHRSAGNWTIVLGKTIVYFETIHGEISLSESHVEETLRALRAAMVLDDLANV